MLPRLWRRIEELGVPSEKMLVISRIYENITCCVRMCNEILDSFKNTIGVKQGCLLSQLYLVYEEIYLICHLVNIFGNE